MPGYRRGAMPWLAAAFLIDAAATLGVALYLSRRPVDAGALATLAAVALLGLALLFVVAWKLVDLTFGRVTGRAAAEVRAIACGGNRAAIDAPGYRALAPLPEAINELAARFVEARDGTSQELARATAHADETALRLAAVLDNLREGVVVCNLRDQVVLYNRAARDMLSAVGPLGLSRSLCQLLAPSPVHHMLAVLTGRAGTGDGGAPFLASTLDGQRLFDAHMTLVQAHDGSVAGYVVALQDFAPQVAALARRDALLREIAEVLAPLRMQVGEAATVPLRPDAIETAVRRATDGYREALGEWWPMADLFSTDLFTLVATRCAEAGRKVTATGLPVWLRADSHSLALALESLIGGLELRPGEEEIFLSAEADAAMAWLGIAWRGRRIAERQLEAWMARPLPALAGMSVRDVLNHHAGDAVETGWREGVAQLRLPMKKGVVALPRVQAPLPPRPEFYDMALLARTETAGALGGQPLRDLTYVVFDTETTGLEPSAGDAIVQIGGVRIVNGRILSSETFERIVDPGRPIPPESARFHHVTDEIARGKPPIEVVLPQFKAFAADAVLVAHNAAFDLKFLRQKERACGVSFDNPVLDTMLLSNHLDGPDVGHSLDEICSRYGIEVAGRHTALGDAMATAAVLLRQIQALEGRGVITLDQATRALDLAYVLHQRQRAL